MENVYNIAYHPVSLPASFLLACMTTLTCFAHQEPVLHVFNRQNRAEIEQLESPLYDLYINSFHNVYREFWSDEFKDFMQKNFNHYFEKFKSTDSMTLVIAERDRDMCGWMLYDYDQETGQAIVELICVDTNVRRQGIGKRLISAIRGLAPAVKTISVVTKKINSISPHFYESLGFAKTNFMLPEYNADLMQGYEWNAEEKDASPADIYMSLLNHAGSSSDFAAYEFIFTHRFSPDVKKIVNGQCVADSRDALKQNWHTARATYGTWTIPSDYQVFPSPETNSVTIKHTAQTASNGTLLVIAILTLEEGRITEIFEVYSPV
jgi:N-acetylglutamate synthase-like GNAT family acetyltransferase